MSAAALPDNSPKTPRILVSTFGMGVVASLCAVAGYSFELSTSIFSDQNAMLDILCYGGLILPYFYVRSALLEGSTNNNETLIDAWVLLTFVCVVLLCLVGVRFYFLSDGQQRLRLFTTLLLALTPFIGLYVAMIMQLRKGDDARTEQRRFKNRVLVPAFCTCLVSFTYGWCIGHPTNMAVALPLAIVLVAPGVFMTAKHWGTSILVVAIAVPLIYVISRVVGSDVGNVIAVGTVLTFAMGVAEVCKRTIWINQNRPNTGAVIRGEDQDFYMAGSNWSSATFPLLLFFLPLLITGLSVAPIFLVSAAQFLFWHFWPNKNSNVLAWVNVVLGFALPLMIILQRNPLIGDLHSSVKFIDLMGYTALFVALTGVATAPWNDGFQSFLKRAWERETYGDSLASYFLFLFVAFSLILIIGYFCLWADPQGEFLRKGMLTILYILALIAVSTVILLLKNAMMHRTSISTQTDSQGP